MFLDNKYTKLYFKIIESARHVIKITNDGKQTHHIIPICMGGADSEENKVVLSYKQHRVVHRLLINMTTGNYKIKLSYAYSFFGKSAGKYKRGKDNIFSSPEIKKIVRERMIKNNPMKNSKQRERMRLKNNNPLTKSIEIEGKIFPSLNSAARYFNCTPHAVKKAIIENISINLSKKKYIRNTSIIVNGISFKSKKAAQKYFKIDRKKLLKLIEKNLSVI